MLVSEIRNLIWGYMHGRIAPNSETISPNDHDKKTLDDWIAAHDPTASPTESDKGSGRWWCPRCGVAVLPSAVTFNEIHDPREGGCGTLVRWEATPVIAQSDKEIVKRYAAEIMKPCGDGSDSQPLESILTRFLAEARRGVDVERPKIITLCGSSRFTDVMAILAWEFEKEGYITLGLHLLPMDYAKCESHLAEKQGVAEKMDALHKQKIKLGDEIFIVNVDGYIGDSTKSEIRFALEHNKRIRWLQPEHADDNLAAALLAAKKEGM